VSDLGSDKIAACQWPTLPTGIGLLFYTATPPFPPHSRPVEVQGSHDLDDHVEFRGLLFERVAASADSQSFLNHFRHLGI